MRKSFLYFPDSFNLSKQRLNLILFLRLLPDIFVLGFKVALIQLNVTADKSLNIDNALKYVQTAKENSAEIAILPECFNSPYGTSNYRAIDLFDKYCSFSRSSIEAVLS